MIPLNLVAEIIGVTASGAFSPGPLTLSTMVGGRTVGARYGLLVALGHMLVELPLFLLLSFGSLLAAVGSGTLKIAALLGGLSLLVYAALTLKALLAEGTPARVSMPATQPLAVGFLLTAFNPYFLAWWFSAGFKLVLDIISYSRDLVFLSVAYVSHVWMDYLWLAAVAWLARRGELSAPKVMVPVQIALTLILVYYGVTFLSEAFT